MRPQTRYARSGDVYVGYQVFGEGPFDLVVAPGALSNIEYGWEFESWRNFYGSLASFARVILFDKRGTGISDPVVGAPSLEERMDDVRAVLDATGSERAVLHGAFDGAAMVALFAATYPERTAALALYRPIVRGAWAPDYPWGQREDRASFPGKEYAGPDHMKTWVAAYTPSRSGDSDFAESMGSYMRVAASPSTREHLFRMNLAIDVRPILSTIRAPTLVMHRDLPVQASPSDYIGTLVNTPLDASRYVAEQISGARFVELPAGDVIFWGGDFADQVRTLREFLSQARESDAWDAAEPDRVLTTVLFTDIVGSSAQASRLGDARWRELLQAHHELIRKQLIRFRGRELDTAGDGFLASFDGPARAVRCACAISDAVHELGLEVRAGLHTGECELIDGKVGGVAVHIGARVAASSEPGEVRVSSTVKDLVAGSGLEFEARGVHELKGIPNKWQLFAVSRRS
jgi:class 3 adenylate cyclase